MIRNLAEKKSSNLNYSNLLVEIKVGNNEHKLNEQFYVDYLIKLACKLKVFNYNARIHRAT